MFSPITIPFEAKMLFDTLALKLGVELEELGMLCTDIKELGYDMLWQGMPE